MDNYEISRDRAQKYFMGLDQEQIIKKWKLKHDSGYIYVRFLGRDYRICRDRGSIYRLWDGKQAGFGEVLSIFDLLCHEGSGKYITGYYAPVNSLKNAPKTAGVGTDFHSITAQLFDKNPVGFQQACTFLGGVQVDMGDIGFCFPVFADLKVILKFYHSDEDFSAGLTLLWDENTLQYMFYETVFYVGGFLLSSIVQAMGQ